MGILLDILGGKRASKTTRANLRRSMIDGTLYSVMVGVGEQYLPAFVLALSLGEIASGLIVTVPQLLGAAVQLLSSRAVALMRSHKWFVVFSAGVQAAAFAPLIAAALLGWFPRWLLFLLVSLYWASGQAAGAAWSTWIGTLVPRRARARWFGLRQRSLQFGTLVGFMTGGAALGLASGWTSSGEMFSTQTVLWTFAGLFVAAGLCRAGSTMLLARQAEPVPMPAGHRRVGLLAMFSGMGGRRSGHGARLIAYMLMVTLAQNVATPFLTPYLLEQVHMGYMDYSVLMGTVMAAKMGALAALGRYAHKHGTRKLLIIGGIGVVPLAVMWTVSAGFWWLFFVQVLSGVLWGCYELATFLMFLERLDENERTSMMSNYFFLNTLAMATGSLLGGWMIDALGHGVRAYMIVFVCSSSMRVFTIAALFWAAGKGRGPTTISSPGAFDEEAWPER